MGEKIVVGPINKGLRTDRTEFVIDNDSFPSLINAYQWRGRIKRKRGTSFLCRLNRFFSSPSSSYSTIQTITLDGTGHGNIITGFDLETGSSIIPGNMIITDQSTSIAYTDPSEDGTLSPSGTINYATGAIVISAAANHAITVSFFYYPSLPVMGLEKSSLIITADPGTIAFDTTYAYNVLDTVPYDAYSVSFYKNPPSSGTYVTKSAVTPISWNGQNYQQFWSTNYQGALWVTNGINIPFNGTNIGMQFQTPASATQTSATTVNFVIANCPLVVGDFVFSNEFTGSSATTLNLQSGYVTAISGMVSSLTVTVKFPNAAIGGAGLVPGILQYLTTRVDITKDCIRWYDGDPTSGDTDPPVLNGNKGWVNFCPPLASGSISIPDLPKQLYYLVSARMIVPFKDRLLFIGPVVQTSSGTPIYLSDTVMYSQNGTPYYTASFTGDPLSSATFFNPILVPANETASPPAFFEDVPGNYGGFIQAGISQAITTVSPNEDVLIMGFSNIQTRFIYTGNDLNPFAFFVINSELGSTSTFSSINLDKGVISVGNEGIILTAQTEAQRIDLDIPDQIFQFRLEGNGTERVCSQRDFINEWIYFTYLSNQYSSIFPNQSLQFNYRDNSWGIFYESYTTYGSFKRKTGTRWSQIGLIYPTWSVWNDPWNSGNSTLLQDQVIAGNQKGFVVFRGVGTGESNSLSINNIVTSVVTCNNHGLNSGDFIVISNCLGTVGPLINGRIFEVTVTDLNNFSILPPIEGTNTYLGNGVIKRFYIPFIQSKQFPTSWGMSRKTRLGVQQYLLSRTNNAQVTLHIYLSQNANSPYNSGNIVPSEGSSNDGLIYSSVLYTCPESSNLGLTPANTNLNLITASQQQQIWHRINTSLLGDTVQFAITLSNQQMSTYTPSFASFSITSISNASSCIVACDANYVKGTLVVIQGVKGMTEINFIPPNQNVFYVLSSTTTTVTLDLDTTNFSVYLGLGIISIASPVYQDDEIEFHACILECYPSQVLA